MPGQFDLQCFSVFDTDGTISKVEFFVDSDGDGELTAADEKLGEATEPTVSGGSFYRHFCTAPGSGNYRFFAVATDNDGKPSNLVTGTGTAP